MFSAFMSTLETRAETWSISGVRAKVAAFVFFGLVIALAARYIPIEPLQITAGSIGGVLIFVGGYLLWFGGLSPELKEQLDWRGNWTLAKRRMAAVWIGLGWFGFVVALGRIAGGPVIGAVTVAALLMVWRMASATPEERAVLNEQLQAQADRNAEAADVTVYDDDEIDTSESLIEDTEEYYEAQPGSYGYSDVDTAAAPAADAGEKEEEIVEPSKRGPFGVSS
jgi:signal transduction histidine kinase